MIYATCRHCRFAIDTEYIRIRAITHYYYYAMRDAYAYAA